MKNKLMLYGNIGGKIDGDMVAQMLNGMTAEDEIEVRINSVGGSVIQGHSIYQALLNSPAKVIVYIDYLAASIASLIMLAGDEINIVANGRIMIHSPFMNGKMDKKMSEGLMVMDTDLRKLMAERTGKGLDWVNSVMKSTKDTWINAAEAKEMGLVDNIIDIEKRVNNEFDELEMSNEEILEVYNELIKEDEKEVEGVDETIYTTDKKYIQKNKSSKMEKIFNVLNLEIEKIAEDQRDSVIAAKAEEILDSLTTIQSELAEAKLEKDGLEKTVSSLEEAKAVLEVELNEYKEADVKAVENKIEEILDKAFEDGKMSSDADRDFYAENLRNNFEKTVSVIDNIPGKILLIDVVKASVNEDTAIADKNEVPFV